MKTQTTDRRNPFTVTDKIILLVSLAIGTALFLTSALLAITV